ncbi:hypothetical protein E1B28_008088 [Marasmius oreades]|uniref:Uncharacterized protein n=1 Tax=Marasmius oreades TaxID=181124 RepID=A0A9P7UUN7_9AGAR|nr:uncharacterized protein E1B28_008088 [Marasmius oreades]KAG7094490.1 hypothetical protein E1B28_008088 [Marasmius oreades]
MNRWDPHTTTQVMLEDADDWVRLEDGQQAITERNPNGITSPSMYSLISESEAQNGEMVLGGVSTSSEGGNFMGWLQKGWLNRRAQGEIYKLKADLDRIVPKAPEEDDHGSPVVVSPYT